MTDSSTEVFILPGLRITFDKGSDALTYNVMVDQEAVEQRKNWISNRESKIVRERDFLVEIHGSKDLKILQAARHLFDEKMAITQRIGTSAKFTAKSETFKNWNQDKQKTDKFTISTRPEYRLRVGNLPCETTERDLTELLDGMLIKARKITSTMDGRSLYKVFVPKNHATNMPLNYGFITVGDEKLLKMFIDYLNELPYGTTILKASVAENRKQF